MALQSHSTFIAGTLTLYTWEPDASRKGPPWLFRVNPREGEWPLATAKWRVNEALAAGHNVRIENAKGEIVFAAHKGRSEFSSGCGCVLAGVWTVNYYHGGTGRLNVGDAVLPPSATGFPCTSDYGGGAIHNRSRVYITTSYTAALMFAALHPSGLGCVYQVEPNGPLVHDQDCDQEGLSLECESATVTKVFRLSRKAINKIRRKTAAA